MLAVHRLEQSPGIDGPDTGVVLVGELAVERSSKQPFDIGVADIVRASRAVQDDSYFFSGVKSCQITEQPFGSPDRRQFGRQNDQNGRTVSRDNFHLVLIQVCW